MIEANFTPGAIQANIALGFYFLLGVSITIWVYRGGVEDKKECLMFGGLMIYYASFLAVIYADVGFRLDYIMSHILKECNFDALTRECKEQAHTNNLIGILDAKAALYFWSAMTLGFIAAPGANFFSKGITGKGPFLAAEDREKWAKNSRFIKKIGLASLFGIILPAILVALLPIIYLFADITIKLD